MIRDIKKDHKYDEAKIAYIAICGAVDRKQKRL